MALTPDEIVNYPLRQAVRGYAVKQVDALLDEVADQIEELSGQLAESRDDAARLRTQLSASGESEATITRTLVTAQRAAEEALAEARREAAELLEAAEADARRVRADAHEAAEAEIAGARGETERLERRLSQLADVERGGRQRMRGELEQLLGTLDSLEAEAGANPLASPPTLEAQPHPPDPGDDQTPLRIRVHDPAAAEGADASEDGSPSGHEAGHDEGVDGPLAGGQAHDASGSPPESVGEDDPAHVGVEPSDHVHDDEPDPT